MNTKELENYCDALLYNAKEVRTKKGAEYSADSDRLKNFKDSASGSCEDFDVIRIFFNKHIASINSILEKLSLAQREGTPLQEVLDKSSEPFNLRLVDAINYLLLMNAMVIEKTVEIGNGYTLPNFSNYTTIRLFDGKLARVGSCVMARPLAFACGCVGVIVDITEDVVTLNIGEPELYLTKASLLETVEENEFLSTFKMSLGFPTKLKTFEKSNPQL